MSNFQTLIAKEREILTLSADADDEGTNSMMSDFITETEKVVWELNSYLK